MILKDIIKGIKTIEIQGNTNIEISNLSLNSKNIKPNGLFVAIKGNFSDGNAYIENAIENGAKAIIYQGEAPKAKNVTFIEVENSALVVASVSSAFYQNPSHSLKLVGVTGTNGKTTTATLLYQLFKNAGSKVGLISTVAIYINQEKYETKNTTPDSPTINYFLQKMVQQGVQYCFMEVSSHAVVQHRIDGLKFEGAVFSNLTHDHLDYHKTFSAYRDAKKAFFDTLTPEAFSLVNKDDANGEFMVQNTKAKKFTYALRSIADFSLKIVENNLFGLVVKINNQEIWTNLIGNFNAYNLLSVYACAILLGLDKETALRLLSTLKPVDGRFQYVVSPNKITAVVDYAHSPDALENVISTINDIRDPKGKLLTVFGCGGDRDKTKRPVMGEIATRLSDKVIITSDNPREEDPQEIISDIEKGIPHNLKDKYTKIADRAKAIQAAYDKAQSGDVILIAGKGHENYQEIKGVRSHFDDLEIIKKLFLNDNL